MTRTIAAKPTTYKGINMRSRLEARWAAMFDLLGWRWEYEPEAGDGYIPDFLLHGFGKYARKVYVEVKPEIIYRAEREVIISKARSAIGNSMDLLVVCDGPFLADDGMDTAAIGFMPPCNTEEEAIFRHNERYRDIDLYGTDEQARLIRIADMDDVFDINHVWGDWMARLTGYYAGDHFVALSMKDALLLWSQAGNAIQWKPG